MFLHTRGSHESGHRDERAYYRNQASLRGARPEKGGQEGPLGEPVYSKDGGDEGSRHATDAKCAADGHGRLPDAGGHGSPTPDCSEVLRPSTSPRPTAEVAAAEYDETLWSKPGRGHDRNANEPRSGYGQHDARHGCPKGRCPSTGPKDGSSAGHGDGRAGDGDDE